MREIMRWSRAEIDADTMRDVLLGGDRRLTIGGVNVHSDPGAEPLPQPVTRQSLADHLNQAAWRRNPPPRPVPQPPRVPDNPRPLFLDVSNIYRPADRSAFQHPALH